MMVNRSPAIPTFIGSIRLSAAAVATAASTAFPPFIRMRRPAWAATDWLVVTIPCCAMVSDRPCLAQPSDRSPGTAVQNAGLGVPDGTLQDWTGDCALAERGQTAAANRARQTNRFTVLLLFQSAANAASLPG